MQTDELLILLGSPPYILGGLALAWLAIKTWRKWHGKAERIRTYKLILASILPPEMLTENGFLRTPTGEGEKINISAAGRRASYDGGLALKVFRNNLEKAKELLEPEEYSVLKIFIDDALASQGNEDTIEIFGGGHGRSLVHETFHDIQGYLYDYYPSVIEQLLSGAEKHKNAIQQWYESPRNEKWTGPGTYQLETLYPESMDDVPYPITILWQASASLLSSKRMSSTAAMNQVYAPSHLDLGRLETIPVLLGASSEGNSEAAAILKEMFSDAGLKADFYDTLPQFV